jgi:hypothetical protein
MKQKHFLKSCLILAGLIISIQTDAQIISQYVETNSGTTPKGIEIWNNTGSILNFSTNNLVIEKGVGGNSPEADITISTGTLAAGAVMVIGTSNMGTYLTDEGLTTVLYVAKTFTFDGDDALVVKYGGDITDMFGTSGSDPGTEWIGSGVRTKNQNIRLIDERDGAGTGISTGDTDGWTDPSTRFVTVSINPCCTDGLEGFGIPPITTDWDGSTDTSWIVADNWSNGIPGVTSNVNLGASKTIVIPAGTTVEINTIILASTAILSLKSTSITYAGIIAENVYSSGLINYERYVNNETDGGARGNDLIAAPLSGQYFNDFADENSNIPVITGTTMLFGPYDNDNPTSYETWDSSNTTVLAAGVGYRSGSSDDNSPFTFTGTVNTGTVTVAITSPVGGSRWNLIGNPYPSYLKIDDGADGFLNNSTNAGLLDDSTVAIYGYNATDSGGIWTIYNLANSDENTLLAPGQGFFVASKTVLGGDIEFTPAMRSSGTSDDVISGRTSTRSSDNYNLKLQLVSGSKMYKTDFYFNDNSSLGLDPGYDAAVYGSGAPSFAVYSHLVQDNTGIDMGIQSLSIQDLENVTIPLGINAASGEQFTLSIASSTLEAGTYVYLKDHVANELTFLNDTDFSYTPSEDLTTTGQFSIVFSTSEVLAIEGINAQNELEIYTSFSEKALYINGLLNDATNVEIFDIQGRKMLSRTLNQNNSSNRIELSHLKTGLYIVKVSSNSINQTKKVIVN